MQGNNFLSDSEADNALDKILNVIGASKRFVLQSCDNINNAVALSYKGVRYIMYDPEFMQMLSYSNNWSNMFVLAHEVGHHINGHSVDAILLMNDVVSNVPLSKKRIQELEADEFAGFVLGRLGAKLSDATSAVSKMSDGDDSYSTHPRRSRRIAAIKKGFSESGGKVNVNQRDNKITSSKYSNKRFNTAGNVIKNFGADIYEGTVDKNGSPFGVGVWKFANGSVYKGEFFAGKFNGYGVIKWASGASYEGDFLNDMRTGYGVYTQDDGIKQVGQFVDNKVVKFTLVVPNPTWEQEFEYSNGNLIYRKSTWIKDGKVKEEGFLDNSSGNGNATFTYMDGTKIKARFENGVIKKSRGLLRYANGYQRFTSPINRKLNKRYSKAGIEYGLLDLIPEYVRGELNFSKETLNMYRAGLSWYKPDDNDYDHLGYGICEWEDGDIYKGYFRAGTKQMAGYGEVFYDNDDNRSSYLGIWWDDKKNGYGQMTYKNGKVEKGVFKNNEFIKKEDFDLEIMQELFKGY